MIVVLCHLSNFSAISWRTSVGNVADFFVYLHSVKKCKVATIIDQQSVQNIKVGVVVQLALMETFQN